MFVEDTEVLELQSGRAVVSTKNLYRIIELLKGKIVGELASLDEASMAARMDTTVKPYAPRRVAVDYDLYRFLEEQGIELIDIAVAPIPKGCCRWCGSSLDKKERRTKTFACGTVAKKEKGARWYVTDSQSLECKQGELQRERIMAEKSEKLKQILLKAGATINPDEWWLLDGRPNDAQFVVPRPAKYAASA